MAWWLRRDWNREEQVREIYQVRNWEDTKYLLDLYQVRYIYIGYIEQNSYEINFNKFDAHLPLFIKTIQLLFTNIYLNMNFSIDTLHSGDGMG